MPDHYFVVQDFLELNRSELLNFTYNWSNLGVRGRVLEVLWLDPSDRLAVVNHLSPRLHKGIKNDIAVEVDHGNSGKAVTLLGQDPLTIDRQNFRLPVNSSKSVEMS